MWARFIRRRRTKGLKILDLEPLDFRCSVGGNELVLWARWVAINECCGMSTGWEAGAVWWALGGNYQEGVVVWRCRMCLGVTAGCHRGRNYS